MFRNFLSPGSTEIVNSVVTSSWQFADLTPSICRVWLTSFRLLWQGGLEEAHGCSSCGSFFQSCWSLRLQRSTVVLQSHISCRLNRET